MTSNLLRKAAQNNVAWCQAVANAHAKPNQLLSGLWCSTAALPPHYPNVITAAPQALNSLFINNVMAKAPFRWSIKDSFNEFDARFSNYQLVMTAHWYGYQSEKSKPSKFDFLAFGVVENDQQLEQWLTAFSDALEQAQTEGEIFNSQLIAKPEVELVFFLDGEEISCGAALHHSHEVIGITHLFGSDEEQQRLIKTLQLTYPKTDIVGFGDEAELALLKPFGFVELGKLNILQCPTN